MAPILVTGGTGTLGRAVVSRLTASGAPVRVLSRRSRPANLPSGVTWATADLRSAATLDEALADVDTIIHCASDPRAPGSDVSGTANLIAGARTAGSRHLVYISIVGVDRLPLGYYRAKLAVERLIEASPVPFTMLRTTQFHELLLTLLRRAARLPVLPVPAHTYCQPIDSGEVADRLVDLARGDAAGRVTDLGGPQVLSLTTVVHTYLRVSGQHRSVLPVLVPGRVARGYRSGAHLAPGHADGRRTFAEFLAAQDDRTSADARAAAIELTGPTAPRLPPFVGRRA